jgi:hypothetical protein
MCSEISASRNVSWFALTCNIDNVHTLTRRADVQGTPQHNSDPILESRAVLLKPTRSGSGGGSSSRRVTLKHKFAAEAKWETAAAIEADTAAAQWQQRRNGSERSRYSSGAMAAIEADAAAAHWQL